MNKDDLTKIRGDEFREPGPMKLKRPGQLTSHKPGLVRPTIETKTAPLPQNGGDELYLKYGESESGSEVITPDRQRDELGRFATSKDKK